MSWSSYLGFSADPCIGISIDANSVTVLELNKSWRGYRVRRYGYALFDIPLPPDSLPGEEQVLPALQSACAQFGPPPNLAALALPDAWVHTMLLCLPKRLPRDECMAQIRLGMMKLNIGPWDAFYMDYLSCSVSPLEQRLTVIFAPKQLVDTWVGWVTQGALKVTVIELTSLALKRSAAHLSPHWLEAVNKDSSVNLPTTLSICAGLALRRYTR